MQIQKYLVPAGYSQDRSPYIAQSPGRKHGTPVLKTRHPDGSVRTPEPPTEKGSQTTPTDDGSRAVKPAVFFIPFGPAGGFYVNK